MYLIKFLTPINRKFYKQHQIAGHHQSVKRNAIEIKMALSWRVDDGPTLYVAGYRPERNTRKENAEFYQDQNNIQGF